MTAHEPPGYWGDCASLTRLPNYWPLDLGSWRLNCCAPGMEWRSYHYITRRAIYHLCCKWGTTIYISQEEILTLSTALGVCWLFGEEIHGRCAELQGKFYISLIEFMTKVFILESHRQQRESKAVAQPKDESCFLILCMATRLEVPTRL